MGKQPAVTVGDLTDQTGTAGPHSILYCDRCGAVNSANAGDYQDWDKDHVFVCCGRNMRLVQLGRKKT